MYVIEITLRKYFTKNDRVVGLDKAHYFTLLGYAKAAKERMEFKGYDCRLLEVDLVEGQYKEVTDL